MTVPVSLCVCALNALQNSMMLIPCWPSAGPTGGAGLACPAFACSLIVVRTFFAMSGLSLSGSCAGGLRARGGRSELLDLVEADLDGRLAAEDGDEDLQARGVLVD